jgi:hypothetical protein
MTLPSCLLPLLSCSIFYQFLSLLLPVITIVIGLTQITVFCNNFWVPTFLLIFCLHNFFTLNFSCLFYSVSFSVSSLCPSFLLLKPHIPLAFLFFKSSKQTLEHTQPSSQWVRWVRITCVNLTSYLHILSILRPDGDKSSFSISLHGVTFEYA